MPSAADPPSAAPASADPPSAAPASADPPSAAPASADPPSAAPASADPPSAAPASADPPSAAPASAAPSAADPSAAAVPGGGVGGYPPGVPGAYRSWLELRFDEPRLPLRRVVGLVGAVVAGLTLLGVPLGLLWARLAPATPVIKTAQGAIYAEPQPEQPIAADGWFSLLALGLGILAAIGLWFLLRRLRGPAGLVALTVGGIGAALVAWQVGRRIGWSTYQRLLAEAPAGQAFERPVDLRAGGVERVLGVLPVPYGNVLLVAFGAAVTYTLLAGWSRWPSLHPEPEPPLWSGGPGGVDQVSWGSVAPPAPTTAPEPPGPGAAEPPRG
ncbi:DUF2567 domain-containing protein [Micromonospora yangpuensis]|uniref:DUF2567 domain-containing protein n=1 Tax=Micromonospora yangpuensis TaxID=683228 RepID=UPI003CC7E436